MYNKDASFFDLMVPTADTYKHRYCLEKLLSIEKPVFFTGDTGVGKSVVIQNTFEILKEEKQCPLQPIFINFSAQTDSKRVQQAMEDKFEKQTRTRYGAAPGKRLGIFVDDINMPTVEEYGAQPPIELLRLFLDKGGIYDRDEWQWKAVVDTTLVAAAAPPIGGRAKLTPRFSTKFNIFCLPQASAGTL